MTDHIVDEFADQITRLAEKVMRLQVENRRLREALASIELQAESGHSEAHWVSILKTAGKALEVRE
jgi:regulator of replication initiation timing